MKKLQVDLGLGIVTLTTIEIVGEPNKFLLEWDDGLEVFHTMSLALMRVAVLAQAVTHNETFVNDSWTFKHNATTFLTKETN